MQQLVNFKFSSRGSKQISVRIHYYSLMNRFENWLLLCMFPSVVLVRSYRYPGSIFSNIFGGMRKSNILVASDNDEVLLLVAILDASDEYQSLFLLL